MAEVTAQMVKELRQATGAGILDCKKALSETGGDFDQSTKILREKGLAGADKKRGRATNEGFIGTYVHAGSKMSSMVALNCETDFVARTDDFQSLANEIAMHVVAARPSYVSREEVPADVIEAEKVIYLAQMADSGKPEHILEKIIEGKLDKWYSEICLLEQDFVKDPDSKIQDLLTQGIASLGENIQISRFARLEIGE